jgi:23S rRNA pseudouridine1911/1915/1917 synthase
MNELFFTVAQDEAGLRLDKYLADCIPGLSRSAVAKLIDDGKVKTGEKIAVKSAKTTAGDTICVMLDEPQEVDIAAEDIPLDIVYEDEDLLVVNKPKGMVVHPAPGNYTGTLVNALMHHCGDQLSGINGELRPGIVHRIDKDTSGLLVVAKSNIAHNGLAEQIRDHSFTREYLAVAYGNIKEDERTVDAPIGRHKIDRKRMCVTTLNSKPAVTHITVLERYSGFTYIRCRLETGRTHQIRVHLAHIGHPIAGDPVYGPAKVITALQGQCLHAYRLGFVHPVSGEYLEFTANVPQVFADFLLKLRAQ